MNRRIKKKKAKQQQEREELESCLYQLALMHTLTTWAWRPNPYFGGPAMFGQEDNFGCCGHF